MAIKILHINVNYIYNSLHKCMIQQLDGYQNICNNIFMPTNDNKLLLKNIDPNLFIYKCFNKFDRLFFKHKQRKIFSKLNNNVDLTQYDLLHAYTLYTDGNCARKIFKKYGIPYVVAIRNTDVNAFFRLRPDLRKRGIEIMKDSKVIFFLSDTHKNIVMEKYIPDKYKKLIYDKSFVIPNGADNYWFENIGSKQEIGIKIEKEVRLIYVGRIDKNKNIKTTQKAIDILNKRGYNVSLTVIGQIDNVKVYNSIKKHERTKFINAMPKEELIKQYRQHDIFVMPSYSESFGLVYVEAMSQGLPVIYSKGQGFDGQFEEGVVGYHVNAYDTIDVANGIEKVISNYESIQSNVVEKSKKFNWKDIAEKYYNIYKEIVKQ